MLAYWIWLAELPRLSTPQKHSLLKYFRDPEELYHAHEAVLNRIPGITQAMLNSLENKDLQPAQDILQTCAGKGIRMLTIADDAYPQRLKNTYDPPLVLYYRGHLPNWDAQPVIGVVGTRKATAYGLRAARQYGCEIAACGGLVISGGAAGADTMALEGAMAAGAAVACVFGCGVDVAYPAKNRKLFDTIAETGCLLSEYPPQAEALGWHFPQRNRILSGLSNGVLVVEAPEGSGALITARLAMEQGRDVYVVPGNVDERSCAGSNALLQDYGIAALSGWDTVKQYQFSFPEKVEKRTLKAADIPIPPPETDKKSVDKKEKSTYSVVNTPPDGLTDRETAVYKQLNREPVTADQVIEALNMPAGTVKAILTKLAIKGLVQNHPGGRVSRK